MLEECYRERRGINDSNECEVRSCLSISPGERAARKAARELFACLSNGEEYITAAQLERKMREIYKLQKKRKSESDDENLDKECDKRNGIRSSPPIHRLSRVDVSYPDVLTEANLVAAAVNYSNGYLPIVSRELSLSTPNPHRLNDIPCFHRPVLYPFEFFTILYHRFVNLMSAFPGNSTFANFQFFIILAAYSIFASDNMISFVPVTIYYFTLAIMIVTSFKMLKSKHDFIDFRIWSGLFLNYGDADRMDTETSEHQFIKNNIKPYFFFFISFIIHLMLHPIVLNDSLILHSEITVISFILIFITMFAFMYTTKPFPDYLILFSFGINVLAKYPYEMDEVVSTGWRFLDLKVPTFSSFVIGNGIEFCLNCRTLLYLLIPGFLIYLAHRCNWRGTYRYLIPHCVTLSWLQICIVSSQCATMFGLVRATLGLAGLLLFLPLFGIVTLLIPVFAIIEWLSLTDPTIRLVVSIIAATFALIGSCIMAANHRTEKYITFLQITVCIVATVFLTFPYMTSNFNVSHSQTSKIYDDLIITKSEPHPDDNPTLPTLTWEMYFKYCHQPAWEHLTKAETQIRCSQLENSFIKWDGQISDVEISQIKNFRADLIRNYLPSTIAEYITCFYGEKSETKCNEREECEINRFIQESKRCHLNKWNTYEYEITIRMTYSGLFNKPAEIVLRASDYFGNFTLRLATSDRVWFRGILRNQQKTSDLNTARLGKDRPIIELTAIGCVACRNTDLSVIKISDGLKINPRMRDLMRGIKYLLNILFNPLLTFK